MRMAAAFLVLLVSAASAQADSGGRATAVTDALGVDARTAEKLIEIVIRYDTETARLQRQRIEVKRRLVLARHEHPKDVELLLEDAIANQRALTQNEEQLIRRTRKILGAKRAAELLVLINATEPDRRDETPPPALADDTPRRPVRDPDALFPPGSTRPPCNPFESMHGCRR
jgi:parvulin-like peptidyl-prolyl isomerase